VTSAPATPTRCPRLWSTASALRSTSGWTPAPRWATAIVTYAAATNINGRFENTVSGSQVLLIALIWAVIAVVNVAYARRQR